MNVIPKYLRVLGRCAIVAVPIVYFAQSAMATVSDKYTAKVPGGLDFSEFRGYESWQVVSISQNNGKLAVILGNPLLIESYAAGIPQNGKPFPDGAKMAKVHWTPKQSEHFPTATVPGTQHDVDFMEKDSERFADSGGWGYAEFEYDAVSGTFRPGDLNDQPPQAKDAKCGFACHTIVRTRDYVFTEYGAR
jgi:Cytochrome P460